MSMVGKDYGMSTESTSVGSSEPSRWKGISWVIALAIIAAVVTGLFSIEMAREYRALLAMVLMFALMLLGMNVGLAMALSGAVGLYAMMGMRPLVAILMEAPITQGSSSTLLVLPMFIYMGLMLWQSGITAKLYAAARIVFAWLPGGLAVTTNIAGAGLGAVSGSTIGSTYALGRIAISEMLTAGYDRRLAVGSVLSAGTIGQLIPPSIMLVIYSGFVEVPVGPQLLAGTIPGIILTVAYVLTVLSVSWFLPAWVGRGQTKETASTDLEMSRTMKLRVIAGAWPIPVLILIIFGGLGGGFLTVTECGVVGALGATLYCLFAQGPRRFVHSTVGACMGTLSAVGSVMFLIIGASIFSRLIAITGVANWLSAGMSGFIGNVAIFFLALVALYLILGMFMDAIGMMLLTTPLILPLVLEAGYSPIWFGVFLVLMAEIGLLTPPIGMLVFIGHGIVQNPEINLGQKITLSDVFVGALLFVPLALGVVILVIAFPTLVTWLPMLSRQ